MLYDFSVSPGDTIATIIHGSDTTDIILLWTGIVHIFGRNLRQWELFLDLSRNFIDDEEYHTVTDNLGLTQWMDFWFGYGLLGAVINGIQYGTVSSNQDKTSDLLIYFILEQNFPNPFNPINTIKYNLPKGSKITLKIFNILRRETTTLINDPQPAGYHQISWDASGYSSGINFFKFRWVIFRM
ncbi:hypothetical protein ISS37_01790 [candidate division KSB1 bacterium]|nr:hypothetical protein [candidate division KSB1 bacterium]